MRTQLFEALTILAICATSSTAFAQLGPKEGASLKPTELERIKVGDKAPDFTLENPDGKRVLGIYLYTSESLYRPLSKKKRKPAIRRKAL